MTHYEVLGVAPGAPTSEVRRAYVALARQHHPDRSGGDADAMRAVNDAWATLRDPARRASYDLTLDRGPNPATASEPQATSDVDDLRADLLDDTPIGGQVVLPRWLALVPVTVFAASIATLGVAVLFNAPALLAVAVALFALSVAMFLVAPFVALLASRRG
jgi:curved DNA-binding protein CbpA